MRNSLTRLSTAREGLIVGNASRIHWSRERIRSFDTVADERRFVSYPWLGVWIQGHTHLKSEENRVKRPNRCKGELFDLSGVVSSALPAEPKQEAYRVRLARLLNRDRWLHFENRSAS